MLTCTFEDGNQANLRHAVTSVLCVRDGQILLVKRADFLINGGKIGLPGGYINLNEQIEMAAKRELYEETGYTTKTSTLFLINDHPRRKNEDRQNVDFIFLVNPGEKTGQPDHESQSIDWYDLKDLPKQTDWAFDHFEITTRYLDYLENPTPLPILHFDY